MKNTKKMDNNGFSLVELIIVIAIMAILIAVVGSQVIPYMEKSRVSKDKSTLDTVYTSLQTVAADFAFSTSGGVATSYPNCAGFNPTPSGSPGADSALQELVGFNASDLAGKWVSKSAKSGGSGTVYGSANLTCSARSCSLYIDTTNSVIAVGVGQLVVSNKAS